jgi:hypothetical protein
MKTHHCNGRVLLLDFRGAAFKVEEDSARRGCRRKA